MTDEQIIKALECCVNADCEKCPSKTICDSDTERFVVKVSDLINRQKAEIERLEYTLLGVMHSVDKWLEGDELKQDEVNRAATMREKTLQIVERLTAQNGVYETCNARQQEAINSLENSLAISKKETRRYVKNYKRQKEEIEEYRNIIERATEGIREVKAMLPRELAKERSEAVKEYAKILKTKVDIDLCSAIDCSDYLTDDLPKIIDNLVKEFTEEKT